MGRVGPESRGMGRERRGDPEGYPSPPSIGVNAPAGLRSKLGQERAAPKSPAGREPSVTTFRRVVYGCGRRAPALPAARAADQRTSTWAETARAFSPSQATLTVPEPRTNQRTRTSDRPWIPRS